MLCANVGMGVGVLVGVAVGVAVGGTAVASVSSGVAVKTAVGISGAAATASEVATGGDGSDAVGSGTTGGVLVISSVARGMHPAALSRIKKTTKSFCISFLIIVNNNHKACCFDGNYMQLWAGCTKK